MKSTIITNEYNITNEDIYIYVYTYSLPNWNKNTVVFAARDPVIIERSNLVNISKLIVKELIETSLKYGRMLDSDHMPLQHFFIVLEHVLRHGLRPKKVNITFELYWKGKLALIAFDFRVSLDPRRSFGIFYNSLRNIAPKRRTLRPVFVIYLLLGIMRFPSLFSIQKLPILKFVNISIYPSFPNINLT